jgi:hypothetical protein
MNAEEMNESARVRWLNQQIEESEATAKREREIREQERIASYTPTEFAPGIFAFLVETMPCVVCERPTIKKPNDHPFPAYHAIAFEAQRDRAGIQEHGDWTDFRKPVCKGCKAAGAQTFECVSCKHRRPLNESKESFGAPAEHICVHCWETVPAKQWAALVEELTEQHRYDFE